MLRAIFFDFNGVLVDDEVIHQELFHEVLSEEGVSLSKEDYYENYVGCDDRGCFTLALESAGREVDPGLLMRLIARKASYYRDRIRRDGFEFFPGAEDLVKAAAADSITLAVVSGALRQEIEDALAQAELRDFFKVVVSSEDVRAGKPNPEGYLRALRELNSRSPLPERLFHPHEILAIEDTPPGLQAAAGAGLVTLGVAQTFARDELSAADVLADNLEGLSMEELQRQFAEASLR